MTQLAICERPALVYLDTKRPKHNDQAVIEEAVARVAPEVLLWMSPTTTTLPEVIEDLTKAIRECRSGDAYTIARNLEERHHWSCDRELVEVLDNLDTYGVHREMVKAWVKAVQPKATKYVGEQVSTKHGDGEITRIDEQTAQYVVFIPSKGHVRSGVGTHGTFFDFEDLDG
jgi:hypothetical protein